MTLVLGGILEIQREIFKFSKRDSRRAVTYDLSDRFVVLRRSAHVPPPSFASAPNRSFDLMEARLLENAIDESDSVREEDDKEKASTLQTALNMMNELEGSGLLGLPYAAKLCGVKAAGVCMVVVGCVAAYTGYLLAATMYENRKPDRKRLSSSYAAVGARAFGAYGQNAVRLVQMFNLSFVGIVYLVLIGNAMESVHSFYPHEGSRSKRLWILVSFCAAFPTVHFGGYRKVWIMSLIGLTALTAIVVLGIAFSCDHIAKHDVASSLPTFELKHLPAAFSMFLFAFSAHGIFPDLEDSMREKNHFGSVVAIVFIVNIALKAIFTGAGVLAYGDEVDPILTANLPVYARSSMAILIAVNTWMSFPLPLIPLFRMIREMRGKTRSCVIPFLERSVVVFFCGIVAVAVPNFAICMGYVDSLHDAVSSRSCFLISLHVNPRRLSHVNRSLSRQCPRPTTTRLFFCPDFHASYRLMGSVTLPFLTYIFRRLTTCSFFPFRRQRRLMNVHDDATRRTPHDRSSCPVLCPSFRRRDFCPNQDDVRCCDRYRRGWLCRWVVLQYTPRNSRRRIVKSIYL